jgi:hypothetical protein
MIARQVPQTSTLREWASFLSVLNNKERNGTLIQPEEDPYRMIGHLERKFPAIRTYRIGKQLKLFVS